MGPLTLPTMGTVYVDAQVLIYFVERHPGYYPLLKGLWAAPSPALDIVTSELSILEVLVQPLARGDQRLVAEFEHVLGGGVRLVPVDRTILRASAALRAAYGKLKTPDAIHASTALRASHTIFLTNDKEFSRIAGLSTLLLDDLLAP